MNTRHAFVLSFLLAAPGLSAQQREPPARPVVPQGAEVPQKPADENAAIDKLIVDGLAAWRAGDTQKAADLLQAAVGQIQARAARGLASFLPTKAAGWTFEEPQVDSGSWGSGKDAMQWSNAEVSASQDDGDRQVRIQITNSPQLFQGMQAMVAAQAQLEAILRQQGKDVSSKTKDGFQVFTIVDDGDANGWIVGKRIAVVVTVDNGDRATIDAAIGWIDLAGLKKLDAK